MDTKTCKTCNIDKHIECFPKQRRECKECVNKKYRVESSSLITVEKLTCSKCNIEKDKERFRPRKSVCKDCVNSRMRTYYKEYYKQNKIKVKAKEKERNNLKMINIDKNSTKECRDCKLEKTIDEFRLNRKQCKSCEKISNKNYMKDKRTNDPIFKLISACRVRLIQCLGKEKNNNTIEYLGEDIELIKTWLEFNFDEKMNWDNHGEYWHIDHVIPVSRFNLKSEEDVYTCFNWKNLSPLSKEENLFKSNNIITEQVNNHISRLKQFSYSNIEKINEYIQILNQFI